MPNLTLISEDGIRAEGARESYIFKRWVKFAAQRCVKPSSGVGRLVVPEELVDTVPLSCLSRRPA